MVKTSKSTAAEQHLRLLVKTSKSTAAEQHLSERIGGSRLDTDSEVWGLDQTTWEQMLAEKAAM